jgi:hypothetical protein
MMRVEFAKEAIMAAIFQRRLPEDAVARLVTSLGRERAAPPQRGMFAL